MPAYIKGIPRETCHYLTAEEQQNTYKADCTGQWIVLQLDFHFCPYCGKHIERDPPSKGEDVA